MIILSLIKPLVKNESLEKLLEEKLDERSAKVIDLQSNIAIQDNALQKLEIKCDDTEQYSCHSSICIHGVEYNENDDINIIIKLKGVVMKLVSSLIWMR